MTDQHDLLQRIKGDEFTDEEMTDLPCQGEPPKHAHPADGNTGIWSWNEGDQECIVGEGVLKVVSYERANEIYQ